MHYQIPCCLMRGGTSRGAYILEKDLPPAGPERDGLLLRLMGSPDIRQIDGLGGATSVTSKVAILAPSARSDADVDYTFAQVSVDKPIVSYSGNCGNISSGVGPFAIESGLVFSPPWETKGGVSHHNPPKKRSAEGQKAGGVFPRPGETQVRIYNTNTQKIITATVQTPEGRVTYDGDFSLAGVPGTAAPVKLAFCNPAGSVTGKLLPTGKPKDTLYVAGMGTVEVSIVDASNPLVFVRAEALGLTGTELPLQINENAALLSLLERIRGEAAKLLGFVADAKDSPILSPGIPKLTLVAPPAPYVTSEGNTVSAGEIDLLGRMMSMQKAHETYALTGAICTMCAACTPGTLVWELTQHRGEQRELRIGHPDGVLHVGIDCTYGPDGMPAIREAYSYRTARMLIRGTAFV